MKLDTATERRITLGRALSTSQEEVAMKALA